MVGIPRKKTGPKKKGGGRKGFTKTTEKRKREPERERKKMGFRQRGKVGTA